MTTEKWTIEDCILASDCVLVEINTIGLQAALAVLLVTVVGFGNYVFYPQLDLDEAAHDLAEDTHSLDTHSCPELISYNMPPIGRALESVLQKVEELRRVSN